MDNAQYEILKQGTKAWNVWREENADVVIDLREADLSGADLRKANLGHADLGEANLSDANLSEADLWNANLSNANLSDAKLWNANLSNANLSDANLSDAKLWKANLSNANLSDANLSDAKLWKANLSGVIWGFDLPDEEELLKKVAQHVVGSPSILDMDMWGSECGTQHCIGGWACVLDEIAKSLSEKYGVSTAACIVLPNHHELMFKTSTGNALKFLERILGNG